MEKIKFLAGTEKRFKEFVANLKSKDKIALISHTDHDGIAAAKVVSKVVKYSLLKFVSYEDINNSLISELKEKKINKVVLTDLSVDDDLYIHELEEFADVLIIDHHVFDKDFNSSKTVFMNAQGYCATYLAYYLFSQIKNLEKLDWLVACASIADYMYFENAEFMSHVFEKYGELFNADEDKIKNNKFWDIQSKISLALIYFNRDLKHVFDNIGNNFGELNGLEKHAEEIENEIDSTIKKFESQKETYGDVYLWEIKSELPIKSIVSNIISSKERDKTFMLLSRKDKYYHISVRRQDKKVNLPEFLEKLLKDFEKSDSGGHIPAAGGHFLVKDIDKLKKKLQKLR